MTLLFQPVNVAEQARSRRLKECGKEDGARNIPAPTASAPSLVEQSIFGDISAERDRTGTGLASQLRAYRDALSSLQTGMDVAGMRHSADEARAQFSEIRSHLGGEIGALRDNAVQLATEMDDFKKKNRLARAPRLPGDRRMAIAWLSVCALVESGLNGVFFASGSDLGLLGGVLLAICLSGLNIVLGFLAGWYSFRSIHSWRWSQSAAGVIGSGVYLAFVLGFNGFVAHYRDQFQSTGDATEPLKVWHHLIGATFDLGSINSWLLFAVGCVFSLFAVVKGHGFDDPYPGFGSHERRRAAASAAYSERRRHLIEDASMIRDDYAEKARNAIEGLKAASSQRHQIQAARARLLAEYNAVEANLADAAQQLLAIYREANLAARNTPPPPHFNVRFTFPERLLDRPEFRLLLGDQGLEHDADSLISEFDVLRKLVLNDYEAVLSHVPGEL